MNAPDSLTRILYYIVSSVRAFKGKCIIQFSNEMDCRDVNLFECKLTNIVLSTQYRARNAFAGLMKLNIIYSNGFFKAITFLLIQMLHSIIMPCKIGI